MELDKETISFRVVKKKKNALDKAAKLMKRDRTYVINEAIDAYLDMQQRQIDHIKEGLRQADSGDFVPDKEMNTLIKKLAGDD